MRFLMKFVQEHGIEGIICPTHNHDGGLNDDIRTDALYLYALTVSKITERLPFIDRELVVDLAILHLYDVVVLIGIFLRA